MARHDKIRALERVLEWSAGDERDGGGLPDDVRAIVEAALRPPRPDDSRITVCAECGSENVEWLDWVGANDGEATATYEGPDTWCPDCEENDLGTEDLETWKATHDEHPPRCKCDACRDRRDAANEDAGDAARELAREDRS